MPALPWTASFRLRAYLENPQAEFSLSSEEEEREKRVIRKGS
jgi:hypothetical protein